MITDSRRDSIREWSIKTTIETAALTAECPMCHQHPTDCICYTARHHRPLEFVTTWKPWKPEPAIEVITVNRLK